MTDRSREDQFSSYKLWVNILEKFYNGISLSRNNTFTGKNAADYLHGALPTIITHKECTREMAVNLLKMFLRDGYFSIYSNKDENVFQDDTAARYKFNDEKVEHFIEDSGFSTRRRVCRAQSLRCTKNSAKLVATSIFPQQKVPPTRKYDPTHSNTRLSLSCGNLSTVNQAAEKSVAASSSSYFIQNTKKNIKSICDTVIKSSENVRNSSLLTRGVSPLIQRISTRSSVRRNDTSASKLSATKRTVVEANANPTKRTVSAITDADEFKLWAHCLAERFRQASGGFSLAHAFSGADVRWNCRMASARGIVARLPERVEKFDSNVDFPSSFIDDLRRLSNWSATSVARPPPRSPRSNDFDTSPLTQRSVETSQRQSTSSRLSTRNTSTDMITCGGRLTPVRLPIDSPLSSRNSAPADPAALFSRICVALVRGKFVPLVDEAFANDLVAVLEQSTKCDDSVGRMTTPHHFGTMSNLTSNSSNVKTRISPNLPLTMAGEAPATRLTLASNRQNHNENEENVASPPMRTRLQRKKLSMNGPMMSNMSPQKQQKFLICVQLCLLTLEPPTRRKLQIFVLYLERILKNSEVHLHKEKSNRSYILERLSALFIEPKGKVTEVISVNFLALLLDHSQQLLFKLPPWLESDVRQKMDNIVAGKEVLTSDGSVARRSCEAGGVGVYSMHRQLRPRASKTPPASATSAFCERIDSSAFDAQKHQYNDEMLKLLDGIIGNENLDPAKKAEMLRQFYLTYPEVYILRFPVAAADDATAVVETIKEKKAADIDGAQGLISRLRRMMM